MRRIAWVLLILLMAPSYGVAAVPPEIVPGLKTTDVDELILRAMTAFQVPGIAVGIVKDGEVVYAAGHGVLEIGGSQAVDSETLFAIASNTKAFTTAALAILVDEGRISWDDRVIDHLPRFRLADPYVTAVFTIRDLLTHRSGLGPYSGDLMFFPATDFTRDEIIDRLRFLPMTKPFRSEFAYDNNLYMVAGEVLAAVTGSSWENFVQSRILDELELAPCAVTFSRIEKRDNLAHPHAVVDGELRTVIPYHLEAGAAAGSIWCNIDGMNRWVQMHLDSGKTAEGRVLISEKQHQEMWSPQTIRSVDKTAYEWNRTHFAAYGLGWGLSDFDGYLRIRHNGGLPGMVTQVTMLPELELGIVVLTNQQSGSAFNAIAYQILKAQTGAEPKDWIEVFSQRMAERRTQAAAAVEAANANSEVAPPSLPLADYAGIYTDRWRGDVTITEADGRLRMKFSRTEGLVGDLEPHDHDTFIVRWQDRSLDADAYVKFSLGFDGRIESVKMKAVSPMTDPSYDFHDLNLLPKPAIESSR